MKLSNLLMLLLITSLIFSCKKDADIEPDNEYQELINSLEQELTPLSNKALEWTDEELSFLDQIAEKPFIALGEATHGTADFFEAKHRIFKYLAENHNFQIFAIEADFGESLVINRAIQEGRTEDVRQMMADTMLFWTWKTEEVQQMLEWMCTYNQDKPDEQKLQYVGFDCQYYMNNTALIREYLNKANLAFNDYANNFLDIVDSKTIEAFESYSPEMFDLFMDSLSVFRDSLDYYRNDLLAGNTQEEFQLVYRMAEILSQVSEVKYYYGNYDVPVNYRDFYMAENATWLHNYFGGKKMVMWAHNGHIAKNNNYGSGSSLGQYMYNTHGDDYKNLGFLFSFGSFKAIQSTGGSYTGLRSNHIVVDPVPGSLNSIMSQTNTETFVLEITDLDKYPEWIEAFDNDIQYFHIGAVYNMNPEIYYYTYDKSMFDFLIYFRNTSSSNIISSN